jgi:hypothetical protein
MENVPQEERTKAPADPKTTENKQAGNSEEFIDRWVLKPLAYSLEVKFDRGQGSLPNSVKIKVAMFSIFGWGVNESCEPFITALLCVRYLPYYACLPQASEQGAAVRQGSRPDDAGADEAHGIRGCGGSPALKGIQGGYPQGSVTASRRLASYRKTPGTVPTLLGEPYLHHVALRSPSFPV